MPVSCEGARRKSSVLTPCLVSSTPKCRAEQEIRESKMQRTGLGVVGRCSRMACSWMTLSLGLAAAAHAEGLAVAVSPLAQDAIKRVELTGFVSIRGGKIDQDDVAYVNKYTDQWSFSKESVFGLQINTRVTDAVNVSIQVKADGGDEPADLGWAYLEYRMRPELTFRFGRLRAPVFMLSNVVDVGYSYPWVQTPYEVYGWVPFSRYEGVDLRYTASVSQLDFRVNPYLGTTSDQSLQIGDLPFSRQSSQFAGIDLQATWDQVNVRAGYSKYRFELRDSLWDEFVGQLLDGKTYVPAVPPFSDGVKMPGFGDLVNSMMVEGVLQQLLDNPSGAAALGIAATPEQIRAEQQSLRDQYAQFSAIPKMNGKQDASFAALGINWDDGQYLLMSELSRSKVGGLYPDVDSGYLTLGYRFGNWLPHLTFSKMKSTERRSKKPQQMTVDESIWRSRPDSPLNLMADGLSVYSRGLAVIDSLAQPQQESLTLGLRWDPSTGIDVKWEIFQVRPKSNTFGFSFPTLMVENVGKDSTELTDAMLPDPARKLLGYRIAIDAVF
ncbi:Hypothetical protein HDN1F_37210 [gamma proteobacterium HdN1]|nr:Hypothetical protein HDN1F_37210 [gamma proteobacterium HdN1]